MPSLRTLLVLLLAFSADAAVSRKRMRDRPPEITVTSCDANTNHGNKIVSTSRTAKFVETVQITDARPDRKIFLTYHPIVKEDGSKHSFSSDCGNIKHVGLGVVTDMMVDLARITSGRKLVARANAHGAATFEIPTDVCGKQYYEAFDWITSQNCQKTPMGNLHFTPPPPPPAGSEDLCANFPGSDADAATIQSSETDWRWMTNAVGTTDPYVDIPSLECFIKIKEALARINDNNAFNLDDYKDQFDYYDDNDDGVLTFDEFND